MKKALLFISFTLTFSLLSGCMNNKISPIDPSVKTRDQILNPQKYYVPNDLNTVIDLPEQKMKLLDITQILKKQTGYEFQIYDRSIVENLKVYFKDTTLSAFVILKIIDDQYSNILKISINENQKYIEIKHLQ